jgi:hypothetical protein
MNVLSFRPDQHRSPVGNTLPCPAGELGRRSAELRLAAALALRDREDDAAQLRKLDAIEAVARYEARTLAELRAKAEIAFTVQFMERFWADNAALTRVERLGEIGDVAPILASIFNDLMAQ